MMKMPSNARYLITLSTLLLLVWQSNAFRVSFSPSVFSPSVRSRVLVSLARTPSRLKRSNIGWTAELKVYFDLAIRDQAAGRMVFQVSENELPNTVENFRALVTGEKSALDPTLKYKGCEFEFSALYTMGAQYKWSHVCKGRGKNVLGNGKEPTKEPDAMAACRHSCPGSAGSYYGLNVASIETDDFSEEQTLSLQLQKPLGLILEEKDDGAGVWVANVGPSGSAAKDKRIMIGDEILSVCGENVSSSSLDDVMSAIGSAKSTVSLELRRDASMPGGGSPGDNVLAVPVGGPGCGFSRFDIIRVRESPPQWQERLLVNSAVIGSMCSGRPALNAMASGLGPAAIVDCGVL